ncbi:MAG: hypothetical protein LBG24_09155 [Treponema sp.]|jgi:hypothetical protein|nr:hypothetical protein [Treponema sp.]
MELTQADLKRMQTNFEGKADPRRTWGDLRHKLVDMLVIALNAISIGEQTRITDR